MPVIKKKDPVYVYRQNGQERLGYFIPLVYDRVFDVSESQADRYRCTVQFTIPWVMTIVVEAEFAKSAAYQNVKLPPGVTMFPELLAALAAGIEQRVDEEIVTR